MSRCLGSRGPVEGADERKPSTCPVCSRQVGSQRYRGALVRKDHDPRPSREEDGG